MRIQLNLPRPADEDKAKQQITVFRQQKMDDQQKNPIKISKEIGIIEDEIINQSKPKTQDIQQTNSLSSKTTNDTPKSDSQKQSSSYQQSKSSNDTAKTNCQTQSSYQLSKSSGDTTGSYSLTQPHSQQSKFSSLRTFAIPQITTGHTELTINQPTMVHLQEQITHQYRRRNDVLLTLTSDLLEHPIPLNNIQRSILQKRILKLPKEFY
ncbi:MAG: hypothetical protein EZS28_003903 [Streblomastix strix]|uniref:Uncharacterized protein n=1 Tax=Streblomastix strix TaxID=222440 RepID=A0A5J4X1C7_9EUKA|nr:MAG: hypothetical protein EZS28_003903 [Streblomastix strix]